MTLQSSFPINKTVKKSISIHSEDRDISKYESPGEFSIYLPEPIPKVVSVSIDDVVFPKLYLLSDNYFNTKFDLSQNSCCEPHKICEGSYQINGLMKTFQKMTNLDVSYNDNSGVVISSGIMVAYHKESNKFIFISKTPFALKLQSNDAPDYADLKTHWGLGYYLGFDRINKYFDSLSVNGGSYDSNKYMFHSTDSHGFKDDNYKFQVLYDQNSDMYLIHKKINFKSEKYHILVSNSQVRLHGRNEIYLEIDGMNSMDEIDPISNDAQFYKTNSCLTKINIPTYTQRDTLQLDPSFFMGKETILSVPIEKLYKCSFLFRFHDGTKVDFKRMNLSFTLNLTHII